MKIKIVKDKKELGKYVANEIRKEINKNKNTTLGLATGSTPLPVYEELVKLYEEEKIDFSSIKTFNLDEYLGIDETHPEAYHSYMDKNLFSKVNINKENIYIPDTNPEDVEDYCKNYDAKIKETGIDLQLLGLGENGHIGFNEPGESLHAKTHVSKLTESTIEANSRFFESREEVPKKAITMGMDSILSAKKIIVMATGDKKSYPVSMLIDGKEITTNCPATLLLLHHDVTLVVDEPAINSIKKDTKTKVLKRSNLY